MTAFHFIPLHTAPDGKKYGRFVGEDKYTISEKLVRLPLYYGLDLLQVNYISDCIKEFYTQ